MSIGANDASLIAFPGLGGATLPPSLDWLLPVLQQVITEVMASDATPLQKASAVARLGALYLKVYRTIGLEQANKELARRIAALEARLAAAEAAAVEQAGSGKTGGTDDAPIARSLRHTPPLIPAGLDTAEADERAALACMVAAASGRASP